MWCTACKVWHFHGRGGEGGRPSGHRVAHCSPNILYPNGYVLKDCGDLPTALRGKDGLLKKRPRDVEPILDAWLDDHPQWQA